MNADEFYEDFKNTLDFLGLRWGEKHLAKVSVRGDSIIFSYENKSVSIVINNEENAA